MLIDWERLPERLKTPEVRVYYDILAKKRISLIIKRVFDLIMSTILLVLSSPLFIIIALLIKKDSKGTVYYRQERVTQYGRTFFIHKFRTMIMNADKLGSEITSNHDNRVTKIGTFLRKYRLDEFPQLIDVFLGDMTFVGTRPEVPAFVNEYSSEMLATLLLPAGITSQASIKYKDEAKLLEDLTDNQVNSVYLEKILPEKMKYNLESIKEFSLMNDLKTLFATVIEVFR